MLFPQSFELVRHPLLFKLINPVFVFLLHLVLHRLKVPFLNPLYSCPIFFKLPLQSVFNLLVINPRLHKHKLRLKFSFLPPPLIVPLCFHHLDLCVNINFALLSLLQLPYNLLFQLGQPLVMLLNNLLLIPLELRLHLLPLPLKSFAHLLLDLAKVLLATLLFHPRHHLVPQLLPHPLSLLLHFIPILLDLLLNLDPQ